MAKDRVLLLARTMAYQTADFLRAAEAMCVEVTLGTDRCHVLAEAWPEGALARASTTVDFHDAWRAHPRGGNHREEARGRA